MPCCSKKKPSFQRIPNSDDDDFYYGKAESENEEVSFRFIVVPFQCNLCQFLVDLTRHSFR